MDSTSIKHAYMRIEHQISMRRAKTGMYKLYLHTNNTTLIKWREGRRYTASTGQAGEGRSAGGGRGRGCNQRKVGKGICRLLIVCVCVLMVCPSAAAAQFCPRREPAERLPPPWQGHRGWRVDGEAPSPGVGEKGGNGDAIGMGEPVINVGLGNVSVLQTCSENLQNDDVKWWHQKKAKWTTCTVAQLQICTCHLSRMRLSNWIRSPKIWFKFFIFYLHKNIFIF